MARLASNQDIAAALDALAERDERFAAIRSRAGTPLLRRGNADYSGLAEIIVSQQVSSAAADAIWRKVTTGLGAVTADAVHASEPEALQALGLSRPKVRAMKALAEAVVSGALEINGLADHDADTAHDALVAVKGIGPWTANIYLLFCLGHRDAWPAGDLAVQEAMRVGLDLDTRPDQKQTIALAEPWRPYRGAAAHLFWAYYHRLKNREANAMRTEADPA
ncbi:MAG: DNA-3-methyladenine glycosylase 2 family protein [Pseudomonadota bacterium]